MRAKIVTIFLFTFALFVGLLVWRVDDLFFGDKLNWSEAGSRAQMSMVISSLEAQIQNLKDMFVISYPKLAADGKDFSSTEPYSMFQAMMLATPSPVSENMTDWKLSGIVYQAKTSVRNWASSYAALTLKTVKPADLKPGAVGIYSLMDPERNPYLLVLIHGSEEAGASVIAGQSHWMVGLVGPEVFQKLMDRQKGQLSQVYLVNQQAQTLGHTVPEYVGSLLSEDPLVAEINKSGNSSGSGFFKNLKGQEIQGMYEQVGATNVFAVISTPMQELLKNRESIRWQFILLGLGVALLGGAFFAFVDFGGTSKGSNTTSSQMMKMQSPAAPKGPQTVSTANLSAPKSAGIGDDGGGDRSAISRKIAASISHELKTPLTSILGHLQLAKTRTSDSSALEHLVRLENEARQAREIVQKLLIFSGEDKYKTEKASLATAATNALKNVEGRALSKGVKVSKDIQKIPDLVFSPELVSRGIESILTNAIEAMERVPKKELLIKLSQEKNQGAGLAVLKIEDSGEGIAASDLEKIFDPFFTTRASSGHVGLGLSTTLGIVKEFHGEILIHSEKGKGTVVEVRFPLEAATVGVENNPMPKAEVRSAPVVSTVSPEVIPVIEKPGLIVPPLLVDKTIESMMDEDPLADKKLDEQEASSLPPAPEDEFEATLVIEPEQIAASESVLPAVPAPKIETSLDEKQFSSKIDKPKLDLKKKNNRPMDQVQVPIRRPGEHV